MNKHEPDHWLVRPETIRWIWRISIAVAGFSDEELAGWDVDVLSQLDLIDALQAELRDLRDGNRDLAELGRQIEAARAALRAARSMQATS